MLWGGQFVSELGGQLAAFALPAIAVVALGATPLQVGALQAFEFAVVPLVAAFAGVAADRYPRRPLMVGANVVRLLALASIPIAWFVHALVLAQFFAVAAVVAAASVFFDTAYAAFLPAVVGREQYHRGVARMAMSSSVAEALGASGGGAIVEAVGAPFAVVLNVVSFVVSTINLLRLRVNEPRVRAVGQTSVRREARAGYELVARTPALRAVALCTATAYLGGAMATSVLTIYCYRTLHLSPGQFGLILGVANVGLAGAMLARKLSERFGARRVLAGATLLSAAGKFVFLWSAAPIAAIFLGRVLLSFAGPISSTTTQALQTSEVPDAMLGRMNAAMRTITWAALPIGSFAGGAIATVYGIPATIFFGAAISTCAVGWLVATPAMSRRSQRTHVVLNAA